MEGCASDVRGGRCAGGVARAGRGAGLRPEGEGHQPGRQVDRGGAAGGVRRAQGPRRRLAVQGQDGQGLVDRGDRRRHGGHAGDGPVQLEPLHRPRAPAGERRSARAGSRRRRPDQEGDRGADRRDRGRGAPHHGRRDRVRGRGLRRRRRHRRHRRDGRAGARRHRRRAQEGAHGHRHARDRHADIPDRRGDVGRGRGHGLRAGRRARGRGRRRGPRGRARRLVEDADREGSPALPPGGREVHRVEDAPDVLPLRRERPAGRGGGAEGGPGCGARSGGRDHGGRDRAGRRHRHARPLSRSSRRSRPIRTRRCSST